MRDYRLGLALSGGGFRASLFHLGVLRRLAELGLLRHVTQISTVSGGSIVGALYYLYFKHAFEDKQGILSNDDYLEVVHRVEAEFVKGVQDDIRNRLLASPLAQLRELTFGNGFGDRMSRLYNAHFYRSAIAEIFSDEPSKVLKSYMSRGVPLHQLITRLPGQSKNDFRSSGHPDTALPEKSLVDFNESTEYANIPSLVVNATCLNTGGPFYFTLNEIGGPECGFIRTDEVFMLLQYKLLLESLGDKPIEDSHLYFMFDIALQWGEYMERSRPDLPQTAFHRKPDTQVTGCFPKRTRLHLAFYQAVMARYRAGDDFSGETWVPDEFDFDPADDALGSLKQAEHWEAVRHLFEVNLGLLRRAKVAAWILLDHIGWPVDVPDARRGGLTRDEYEAELIRALEEIDGDLAQDFLSDGRLPESLKWLILDIYYFRSATVLNERAYEALHAVTLSQAVAASANFPPMFTPLKIKGLFESRHLPAVHLTDGGVHDNQGLESLLSSGCTHIIVSDAGGLVAVEQSPAESRLPMMDRIIDVLMGGVRRVLLRSVSETLRVSRLLCQPAVVEDELELLAEWRSATSLRMAVVFHMSSHPPDAQPAEGQDHKRLKPFAAHLVARLRTDLDAFNDLEIAALRHQGYHLTDCYAREMANESQFRSEKPPLPPRSPVNLPPSLKEHHAGILAAGARRTARYSSARPLHSALVAAIIALIVSVSATKLDDWSSWSSIRRFTETDFSKYLPRDRTTFYAAMTTTRAWRAFSFGRDVVSEAVSHTSILTVLFISWALMLVGRVLFRASDAGRERVRLQFQRWSRAKTFNNGLKVLLRPANLISLSALALTAWTLHAKWLLGVVHLWTLPIAAFFFFVHRIFTPLWLNAGRLDQPSDGSS